jgi:hypothetical protein
VTFDPNRPTTPESVAPAPVAAATPTPPAARKSGSGGRALNLLLGLAAVVAIGGVAFAAGRNTAPVSAATGGNFGGAAGVPRGSGAPGLGGRGGAGGLGGGAGLTLSGTVQSVTGDTLTITTTAGQTITVTTGASTTYNTQAAGSASDVQTGKKVQVQLEGGGQIRPGASAAPSGPVGTAGSVTVVP